MNGEEQKKALAAIKTMLSARLNSQSAIGPDTVKGYMLAVSDCTLEAIERACKEFIQGTVEDFNNDFAPTAARLADRCRVWDSALRSLAKAREGRERLVVYKMGELPPPPLVPLGPIKLEVDGVMRDVSGLSHAEKEHVIKHGTMPPTEAADPDKIGATVRPALKRM